MGEKLFYAGPKSSSNSLILQEYSILPVNFKNPGSVSITKAEG